MTVIPAEYDFTIYQGSDFNDTITFMQEEGGSPANLTGLALRMQIRRTKNSVNSMIDLTTENGGLISGGILGTIGIYIPAIDTAEFTNDGVYDIEVIHSLTSTERWLEGNITLSKEVTKNG